MIMYFGFCGNHFTKGDVIYYRSFIILCISQSFFNIRLICFCLQMTPVDSKMVAILKSETGENYPKRWSGFKLQLGSVMESQLHVPKEKWHETLYGVSRQELLRLAAKALANTYKKKLMAQVETV